MANDRRTVSEAEARAVLARLRVLDVRLLDEPTDEEALRPIELPPGTELDDARRALDDDIARLNESVFGAHTYALIARA